MSHFINSRIALAIVNKQMNSVAKKDYAIVEYDEIQHYYSLFIDFVSHHDFVDSCAFENMIELDNAIEECGLHDIREWCENDFESHFAFNIKQMHHFNSLSMNRFVELVHNNDECIYCNPAYTIACCEFDMNAVNTNERNSAIAIANSYFGE